MERSKLTIASKLPTASELVAMHIWNAKKLATFARNWYPLAVRSRACLLWCYSVAVITRAATRLVSFSNYWTTVLNILESRSPRCHARRKNETRGPRKGRRVGSLLTCHLGDEANGS